MFEETCHYHTSVMCGGGGLSWGEGDWSITPLNKKKVLFLLVYAVMCGKHEVQHDYVYLY